MEYPVAINRSGTFTLEEANKVLPIVIRISEVAQKEVEFYNRCLRTLPVDSTDREHELRRKIDDIVELWEVKIQKLGAIPKGLWMADFDNGSGYWCWKHPEKTINHFHGYQDGFSSRQLIDCLGNNRQYQA